MKRITAKLAQGFARLAFWRKPASHSPEQTDTSADAQEDLQSVETALGATAEPSDPRPGAFARLKHFLGRWSSPTAEQSVAPDQSVGTERPAREHLETRADEAPHPKPSLLAQLKKIVRRQPAQETLDAGADESRPDATQSRETTSIREIDEAAGEEMTAQPGRIRRVLAVLSKKRVWIPAASLALLAAVGAPLLILQQATQEKEKLQVELLATRKKLEQTTATRKDATKSNMPTETNDPAVASNDDVVSNPPPGFEMDGCVVSDAKSVSQNLKNCINDFNRSMAGARAPATPP